MKEFLVALAFLTRLPASREALQPSERSLRASVMWFPAVGALVGLVTASIVLFGSRYMSVGIAVSLALIVELRLTGALHEDGLADSCDAFGGGWTRDDVHRILKDSRLGTYGVAALIFGIGLRWQATTTLGTTGVFTDTGNNLTLQFWAIVGAAAMARWVVVLHLAQVPAAPGRSGLADIWKDQGSVPLAGSALVLLPCILPILIIRPAHAVLALFVCYLAHRWMAGYVGRRIGGRTGDTLGALAFASQLIVLLVLLIS